MPYLRLRMSPVHMGGHGIACAHICVTAIVMHRLKAY